MTLSKVLVANRGEIALRLFRACRELGVASVAAFTSVEADAAWVAGADEAVRLEGESAADTYLSFDAVLEACELTGADAVHPGYGFLSENADFARACRDAGITFIGPSPEAMALLGSKVGAKALAESASVPTIPGFDGGGRPAVELASEAEALGFPLLIKASGGGGGRGMRIVHDPAAFEDAVGQARAEAASAFGDDRVLVERYFPRARHVEVQILGDLHGTVIHLFERECSIQRRYQKIIEESPSPGVTEALRREVTEAAVRLGREAEYSSAGTVEFLLDEDGNFYLLEVNTRLQVEHPVTEAVTGVDLAAWQLRIAAGERLELEEPLRLRGHAIEARIYAEDPATGFLPSIGRIDAYRRPGGPGVRFDDGLSEGDEITSRFDPMIAKVIAHASTRAMAIERLDRALSETVVLGVTTNVGYLRDILRRPDFVAGQTYTRFIDEQMSGWSQATPDDDEWLAAAALEVLGAARGAAASGGSQATGHTTRRGPWDELDAFRNVALPRVTS